ncbi:MAG: ATP-binding protein [Aquabacterium sp.]
MASSLRAWWRRWLGADSQPRVIGESLRSVAQGDMNKQPLRRKVMIVVLSTTCLALLLSASALLIYELRDYRAMRIADLRAQADIIDRATTSAVVFGDTKAGRENLSMLRLRPQITAAGIYRNDGTLFATYLKPNVANVAFPTFKTGRSGYEITSGVLEIYHPLRQNNEPLGTLYIRTEYDITGRLIDYLVILLGVMATSLAAAALIMGRLQRSVTDPILQVAQVARDVMAQRDFSLRAPKTSEDEVGELVDAFNGMLAEVAARTTALEQTNHHLSVEMTERHKAEEALKMAARKKDEFLATLAHELRNPLAPISNATEILRRIGNDDPALRLRALDIMSRQLRQMVRLIDDLLDVSRITTGKLLLHPEQVDLVNVLQSAIEIATPLLEKHGHVLQVTGMDEPVHVHGDATRLAQVFANLLNNAAKYTDDQGHIALTLRVGPEGKDVAICIKDNGIGISPDMQSVVFDMFFQVGTSTSDGRTGLGIGLTLARRLISLHGGRIEVHSAGVGQGSEFRVYLPLSVSTVDSMPL